MFIGVFRCSVRLAICLAFTVSPPAVAAEDILRPVPPVQLTIGGHGEPIVAVWVNGNGPFRFVIDTGSSHSAVTARLADALRLRPVAKTVVNTSAGMMMSAVVGLESLSLGEVVIRDLLPSVLASNALDWQGPVDGVVGQDALATHRYTIDFAHRRFLWEEPAGGDAGGAWLPIRFESGRFVVALAQSATTLRLVPDSGTEQLVLYEGTPVTNVTVDRHTPTLWLDTVAGRQAVRHVFVRELCLGVDRLHDVPAAILERGPSTDPASDGLLPLRYFKRVTVDGPGRRLQIER
jgi:predicted aspartyl protease